MHLDEARLSARDEVIGIGSFQLNRTRRLLIKDGAPIAIGGRAMDILLVLTEKPGVIVSHRELLHRVWADMNVAAGSVRVQVASLRKVLRDAGAERDYVHNVTGRGYRFVAQVTRYRRDAESLALHPQGPTVLKLPLRAPSRRNNLPDLLFSVVGRDTVIRDLKERMKSGRLVTVTGRGGSGKSTVAIAAAAHANGVCFLDLAAVREPQELWEMLSAALDVSIRGTDPLPQILRFLSCRSILMVLDNCEYVIETVARLVERVLQRCPQVKVLATSRESLRVSGEIVYELPPLELPAAFERICGRQLMEYSAIRLFVERAGAYAGRQLENDELSRVVEVCRRSVGSPLAIDIAAGQVRWLGMNALSAGLHDAMYLSIEGRRTAARRHRTLRASFDWSYSLLSAAEQAVFRRLSVFVGDFNLDRAAAVIADDRLTHRTVLECLVSLARKSLIMATNSMYESVYRLDSLSRAYASEKLQQVQNSHSCIDKRQ